MDSTSEKQELYRWRKPGSMADSRELARIMFYIAPLTWTVRFYDKHWASKSGRQADMHEITRRAKGDWSIDVPVPLPRIRKRTLTGPLPPLQSLPSMPQTIRRSRQRTDSQDSCGFLKLLPFEIRQDIYDYVLLGGSGAKMVHILRKHGRLGHWRCRIQGKQGICDSDGARCLEGWLSYKCRLWYLDKDGRLDITTDGGLVALLQTCRTIYSEAIRILYARNIFHFHDPGDVRHFGRTTLPQRLNTITALTMDWERLGSIFTRDHSAPQMDSEEWRIWKESWTIISKMENLMELTVVLKPHQYDVPHARRMKMCQPMMEIKGLRKFELVIPRNDTTNWDFAAHAPFKIIRGNDIPMSFA